jgi:hypothetical protein
MFRGDRARHAAIGAGSARRRRERQTERHPVENPTAVIEPPPGWSPAITDGNHARGSIADQGAFGLGEQVCGDVP